jgi:alpha-ketoglutarate-dependent taurine dioxygenase
MNVTYGDGGAIAEADLELVRAAVRAEMTQFDWERGDMLVCDNYLVSHGRRSYTGERKVFVALG